ncbi:hypothetical protein J3Q64DRAFT_1648978 [Phycomyces blakesleeanus]|uniref:SH3 domain-containing protein n=1 Tax=Phycomyces blakesleeanus TaxID=4837 RepID=A0ABR3AK05_PHYBL
MSRNLLINTQLERFHGSRPHWQPSPGTTPISEENGSPATIAKNRPVSTLYEEEEEEEDEEEEEPEDDENESEENDSQDDDDNDNDDDDDEDSSTFTSSPSIPDENIDFNLVYVLRTFIATVEGQASVVKGDSLTLMDDSNSYWWLVKALQTSEVGYIPAENIETPFERLARLNKHRNVTSPQQAMHFIEKKDSRRKKHNKRVTLSKGMFCRSQIIFTADNEEDEHEEFEDWEEEMARSNVSIESTVSSEGSAHDPTPLIFSANRSNTQLTVLRVFAGNINVSATFNTVLVDEHTNADQLLKKAMERFHITQIEGKAASGIEYYLTVKAMDGDEITLAPLDKPLAIFKSLTTHLTTPMPSLTHIKQLSQHLAKARFGEDSVIRFYLHKRIRRINERDGLVYVKLSYYANIPIDEKKDTSLRSPFSTKSLRLKSTPKPPKTVSRSERIDKLVAISANITIADLTLIALDKFHIVHGDKDITPKKNEAPDRYRMTLSINENGNLNLNLSVCVYAVRIEEKEEGKTKHN